MRYLLLLLTANCSRIPTIEEGPVIPLASQTVCVFLVKWFDHQGRRLPTRDEVSAHLNSEDPTSARSWFSEVSHTEVEVTFHVHEWLASPASEAEASGGAFGLGASLNTAVIVRRGFNDDQRALRSQPLDLSPCGQRFHAVLFHSGFDGCWYGKDPHGTAWVSRRAINSRVDRVHAQMTFIYEEVGGASLQRLAVQSVLWGWTQQIARRGTMIHEWMHTQGLTDMCGPPARLGHFDLMCQNKGWKGDYIHFFFGAPHRVMLGLSGVRVVDGYTTLRLLAATGPYQDVVAELPLDTDTRLLVEYRTATGLDQGIPCREGLCGGVVVWRQHLLRGLTIEVANALQGAAGRLGHPGDVVEVGPWKIRVQDLTPDEAVVTITQNFSD